jgi:hypothetical protein
MEAVFEHVGVTPYSILFYSSQSPVVILNNINEFYKRLVAVRRGRPAMT